MTHRSKLKDCKCRGACPGFSKVTAKQRKEYIASEKQLDAALLRNIRAFHEIEDVVGASHVRRCADKLTGKP